MQLTDNARTVLAARYLQRDDSGYIIETPLDRFKKVAEVIGGETLRQEAYDLMTQGWWLPNTPTLANAGRGTGSDQLSACFVLPIEDSIVTPEGDGIMDIARWTAMIHKTGGGTGYSFGRLRHEGAKTKRGTASGPVSFMEIFNVITDVWKQGGIRRGAMMGILPVWHPDIRKFLKAKTQEGRLANFNISVALTDAFMTAVKTAVEFPLQDPRDRSIVTEWVDARGLWDELVQSAWTLGDPGCFFIDRANATNPLRGIADIEATNPCGEIPMPPWDACNLGSINLAHMIVGQGPAAHVNWVRFRQVAAIATELLDNVIDANEIPVPQIQETNKRYRRLGLGVMGWATALNKLQIPYDSDEAVDLARVFSARLQDAAMRKSLELGRKKGTAPISVELKLGWERRNVALTTMAPTGSISTLAERLNEPECSAGIEPYYARATRRDVAIGSLHAEYSDAERPWFRTAMEIEPRWHVAHQAAWQSGVDNAVSKTVNLPFGATKEDVEDVYLQAYDSGCKGVTVYRDGSRGVQVYNTVTSENGREVKVTMESRNASSGARDCGIECEVPSDQHATFWSQP